MIYMDNNETWSSIAHIASYKPESVQLYKHFTTNMSRIKTLCIAIVLLIGALEINSTTGHNYITGELTKASRLVHK